MPRRAMFLVLASVFAVLVQPALAADPSAKTRVLLTYGGHGFEAKQFFAMFDALKDVTYTKAEMPKDAGKLEPGLRPKCDVVVMYDMSPPLTAAQQAAFVQLLNEGIGVVSLHHNLGGHRDWPEFTKIIGGKFVFGPVTLEGKEYKPSTWSHDETLPVTVADKDHPITRGLADFEIHDETYGGYYTASDVKVLLQTNHPKNSPALMWTKTYGKSRIVYLMLGHDHQAWEHPAYPQLLARAIQWAREAGLHRGF